MYLSLDIGNTRIKYGLFEQRKLKQTGSLDGLSPNEIIDWLSNLSVEYAIYSNVRRHFNLPLKHLPKGNTKQSKIKKVIRLQPHTPLPIENRYHTAATLGPDRLAAATGAWAYTKGENCLVIDAGSCITMDLLLDHGFEGGNISPGLEMRLDAMHQFTDGLPRPNLNKHPNLPCSIKNARLGKSTEEALILGACQGLLLEIKGFIEACETQYGPLKICLTGGNAAFLADKLKREIFVLPNLVLRGLNEILLYNAQLDSLDEKGE